MVLSRDDDGTALLGRDDHLALERRAAQALSAQDFLTALRYADRRCRINPPPASPCFVLRAEAAWRLGRAEAALDDLKEALSIDPFDVGANRRMLAWADGDLRRAAAIRLLAYDHDPSSLRSAIKALKQAGERHWAAVSVFDSHVSGWVAWSGDADIEASLALEDGTLTSLLEPDPFHSLASRDIRATNFRLLRPPSSNPQRLTFRCAGKSFQERRLAPNLAAPRSLARTADQNEKDVHSRPTVIVPVYADFAATVACFESLLKSSADQRPFRVLAVDDASPDPELRSYLGELASGHRIDLLVNPVNLGFVGTVNRALAEVSEGDVVLLNADTLVPPGFVERLSAAAHSAPDIGTVTPLSNNGDIFSFPKPGFINAMPSYEEVIALDRASADANPNVVVDTPTGIGFCLYITRSCLNAIEGLSESFERGYLEDVDFCLRAREGGFRNVCAASVYVGHHGSKSFRDDKRGLVLRNLGVLDQRFPVFRKECLAFETADPLKPARARLERALPGPQGPSVLIAVATGAALSIAQARARQLAACGERAIFLVREHGILHLSAFDGGAPQAIILPLDEAASVGAAETITRLKPLRLEITDGVISPELLELAQRLELPTDVWITSDLPLPQLGGNTRVLAPTKAAEAFARAKFPHRKIAPQHWPATPLVVADFSPNTEKSLAIVPGLPSPTSWLAIRAVTIRLKETGLPIVVVGRTCDDQRLMSFPNVLVTGPIKEDELSDALALHNAGWLLTDIDRPLFGHPLIEAVRSANRPVAFRDWSYGAVDIRGEDLAIAPDVPNHRLADAVALWMAAT